jgi:queuine tRNA-ribosyltransferase
LEQAGGLHQFINWQGPILTDSGGYQVYSLSNNRKIKEEGVVFKSHIDGSKHTFTPENVMDIQRSIGADIVMAFDECPPYPCDKKYASDSLTITHKWLDRCFNQWNNTDPKYGYQQALFPIVQGSVYSDLRAKSAEYIANKNAYGNAIGGLSVGEPHEVMYEMTELVCNILPKDKPRYLMGVGTPANILECIGLGVDMFDCVMPTRNARNGMLFTWNGTMNMRNKKWENDFSPLDENGTSYVDSFYTKAYVRHLFVANEILALQIASIHNLAFYLELVRVAREKIIEGTFASWKNSVINTLSTRL